MLNPNLMLVHPAHVTRLPLNQPFLWQNSCHRLLWWKIEHFNSRSPFRRWTRARSAAFSGSLSWRRPDIEIYCLHPTFRGGQRRWNTYISLFSRTGRQKGGREGALVRPHLSEALLIVAEGLFSLQTRRFLPHPLAARPALINTGLIHSLCSLLQLDRWSMKSWYLGMQPPAAAFICIFFRGEMWNSVQFPAIICRWWRGEWVALTPRKDYFPRVNELIFHRYRLEPPLLCCA